MLRFKNYLLESEDPYNWDTNYGKRFKFVETPLNAQNPPQGKPTISLVTPANNDAWNWPEVSKEKLEGLKNNWSEIQKNIGEHKRIQIETGKNTSAFPEVGNTLKSTAANIGAGIVGALVGEYVVKPTAEKLGVFNAVEKGTIAALSNTPNWVANTADAGLGAAQAILDPINALAPAFKQGFENKMNKEVDSMINAGKPSQVRVTGPKF